MQGRTILVGVGNAVLTDDSVGIQVARMAGERLSGRTDVDVREACLGGMELMESLVGYDRAIIVDAMRGGGVPGTVYRSSAEAMFESRNSGCAHNATLGDALEIGRAVGLSLPARVEIVGIEPADVTTFGESLTPAVRDAVPSVVNELLSMLRGER
jgi:hydrogenase maturation protease